jgi:hypothetical protein
MTTASIIGMLVWQRRNPNLILQIVDVAGKPRKISPAAPVIVAPFIMRSGEPVSGKKRQARCGSLHALLDVLQ